jgi:hypothetical protein
VQEKTKNMSPAETLAYFNKKSENSALRKRLTTRDKTKKENNILV